MRRERLIPMIVGAALFMENMDSTVISTSLPAIAGDIGSSPLTLKLAVTSYLLALAVFIPASGWVSDRFGARNVFTAAIVLFIVGSISCALSSSITTFVIARIVQGMGGAMMTPVGRLVLLRSVEKRDLVAAMTWVSVPASIGPIIGPALGGFITTYATWHWIFLINVPIGCLGVFMAQRYIEQVKDDHTEPFDFKGFVLSGIGLSGIAFGMTVAGVELLPWSVVIAVMICGVISMTLYVMHANRIEHPVLDFRLLRVSTMRNALIGGMLFRLAAGASPFLLPLLLQVGFGMTPFQSGSVTFMSAVGALGMKTLTNKILGTYGFRHAMTVTSVLAGIGLGIPALFTAQTTIAVIMGVLLVAGFLRSLQFTAINTIAYADVEAPFMSRATTLVSVAMQIAVCAGVAVGALTVEITLSLKSSQELVASDFAPAFILITLIAASSAIFFWWMPADAGHQISGRRSRVRAEMTDTPPETEAVVLAIANNAEDERKRQKAS